MRRGVAPLLIVLAHSANAACLGGCPARDASSSLRVRFVTHGAQADGFWQAMQANAVGAASTFGADFDPVWVWLGVGEKHSLILIGLMAVLLISGLFVVGTTHSNRYQFNQLQELRSEANALNVEWGQLLIEQSTFGVEGRIEQKAIESLAMRVPNFGQIVMVGN